MFVTRFLIVILLFFSFQLSAQVPSGTYNNRELKQLGQKAERLNDIESAASFYSEYLDGKPNKIKLRYKLAILYRSMGQYQKSAQHFKTVWDEKGKKYPLAQYYYAEMLKANGDCKTAVPEFEAFRKNYRGAKDDRKYRRLAKFNINGCQELSTKKNTSSNEYTYVMPLPSPINGAHLEASPIYLTKDILLFNSVKSNGQTVFEANDEMPERQFYTAKKEEQSWTEEGLWNKQPIVNGREVANGAFNAEKSRFYFSACIVNGLGKVDCDIYRMDKNGISWSSPKKLGEAINTKSTETQPAVGIDEKGRETLYFISDRKGGKGGLDIWYSTYNEDSDSYRKARNCGSKINSVGNEMTPFYDAQGGIFYFSSDGHPGYGQLDVFYSTGQRSKWEEPENMGNEINTSADELYYTKHPTEDEGYFTSNRQKKKGDAYCCDDIYFYKETGKLKLTIVGIVQSEDEYQNVENLANASISLYRIGVDGERYFQSQVKSNVDGAFNLRLSPNQNYVVRVEKKGFLAEEQEFNTMGVIKDKKIVLNKKLRRTVGAFYIADIQYEFNSDKLTEESKKSIDKSLYQLMLSNPYIIIEISSHTDSKGAVEYNQNLSERRAQSAVNYLIQKGISKKRLKAKGYGESKPKVPNTNPDGSDNPENRKINRRTEFEVVGSIKRKDDDD